MEKHLNASIRESQLILARLYGQIAAEEDEKIRNHLQKIIESHERYIRNSQYTLEQIKAEKTQ